YVHWRFAVFGKAQCQAVIESLLLIRAVLAFPVETELRHDATVLRAQRRNVLPVSRVCDDEIPPIRSKERVGREAAHLRMSPERRDDSPGSQRHRLLLTGGYRGFQYKARPDCGEGD